MIYYNDTDRETYDRSTTGCATITVKRDVSTPAPNGWERETVLFLFLRNDFDNISYLVDFS